MEMKLLIGTVVSLKENNETGVVDRVHEFEEDTFGQGKYLYHLSGSDNSCYYYASELTVVSMPKLEPAEFPVHMALPPANGKKIFIIGSCKSSRNIIKLLELEYLQTGNQVQRPLFQDDFEYDMYVEKDGLSGLIRRAYDLISSSDMVIVVPKNPAGEIGTGTRYEMIYAQIIKKPVYVIELANKEVIK